jgi:hypothetical protein
MFRLRPFDRVKGAMTGAPWFWPAGHFMYNTKGDVNSDSKLVALGIVDMCIDVKTRVIFVDLDDTLFMSQGWSIPAFAWKQTRKADSIWTEVILKDPRVEKTSDWYTFL